MDHIPEKRQNFSVLFIVLPAAIAVVALAVSCSRRPGPAREVRNVIIISIDTCRADHLSCYGYPRPTTPNIDGVAGHGVIFTNAYSPVPLTLPAHSSMLTGTIPPYHGVHSNISSKLHESNLTLPEILQQDGFATAGIISSFVLDSSFGLNQGFDSYNDEFVDPQPGSYKNERRAEETSDFACKWLEQNKDNRFFLFVHYYDPHFEYQPPEPFASRFKDSLYAGEIAYVDDQIGRVLRKLKELNLYDSSLMFIVGDHGEMLGEHDEDTHGYFIYQSAVKVPLIVKLPGKNNPRKADDPVTLVDIVPTILNRLKISPPADIHGEDLSEYLSAKLPQGRQRHIYCESLLATTFNRSSLRAVVTEKWKYIQAPRRELYDITADPKESENLAGKNREQLRIMDNRLRYILTKQGHADEQRSSLKPDSKSLARLRSLGYVGGSSDIDNSEFDESKPDPKDFPPGKKASAAGMGALFTVDMFADKHQELAVKYIREGKIAEAVGQYRAGLRMKPKWPKALNALARILATSSDEELRDSEEAIRLAVQACQLTEIENPVYLDTLAMAYAASGRFEEALETAHRALDLAGETARDDLAKQIRIRISLYEQNKPFRQGL